MFQTVEKASLFIILVFFCSLFQFMKCVQWPVKQSSWHCDPNWTTSSNGSTFFRWLARTTPKHKTGRGSARLSLLQKQQTKNGSDHPTSEPLFISGPLFDFFAAYPL